MKLLYISAVSDSLFQTTDPNSPYRVHIYVVVTYLVPKRDTDPSSNVPYVWYLLATEIFHGRSH